MLSIEKIKISRDEMIEHLSQSMFDDLEMNPDYLSLIISMGFMGYNNYSDEDLVSEYKEYISEDNPNNIEVEITA